MTDYTTALKLALEKEERKLARQKAAAEATEAMIATLEKEIKNQTATKK